MNFTNTIERILSEEATPVINSHQDAIEYIKGFLAKGNDFEDIDENVIKKSYFPNKGHMYDHYEEILSIVQSWAKAKRTIQDAQSITTPFLMNGHSIATTRALVEVFNSLEVIPDKTIEIWKEGRREDFFDQVVNWCFNKNIPLQKLVNNSRLSPLINQKVKVRIFLTITSKHQDKLKEMPQEWWEDIFQDIKKSTYGTLDWARESFCNLITKLVLPLSVLIQNFDEFIGKGNLSVPRQIIKSLKNTATREKKINNFSSENYLDISYFKNKQVNEILNYISKTQVDILDRTKKIGHTVGRDIFSLYSNLKEQGLEDADIPQETHNLIKKMYEVGAINEFTDKPFNNLEYEGRIEDFEIKTIFRDTFSLVYCAIHFDFDIEDSKVADYEVTKISDIYIHPIDSNDELTEADLTPEELKHLKTYLYHAFDYYSDKYLNDYNVGED